MNGTAASWPHPRRDVVSVSSGSTTSSSSSTANVMGLCSQRATVMLPIVPRRPMPTPCVRPPSVVSSRASSPSTSIPSQGGSVVAREEEMCDRRSSMSPVEDEIADPVVAPSAIAGGHESLHDVSSIRASGGRDDVPWRSSTCRVSDAWLSSAADAIATIPRQLAQTGDARAGGWAPLSRPQAFVTVPADASAEGPPRLVDAASDWDAASASRLHFSSGYEAVYDGGGGGDDDGDRGNVSSPWRTAEDDSIGCWGVGSQTDDHALLHSLTNGMDEANTADCPDDDNNPLLSVSQRPCPPPRAHHRHHRAALIASPSLRPSVPLPSLLAPFLSPSGTNHGPQRDDNASCGDGLVHTTSDTEMAEQQQHPHPPRRRHHRKVTFDDSILLRERLSIAHLASSTTGRSSSSADAEVWRRDEEAVSAMHVSSATVRHRSAGAKRGRSDEEQEDSDAGLKGWSDVDEEGVEKMEPAQAPAKSLLFSERHETSRFNEGQNNHNDDDDGHGRKSQRDEGVVSAELATLLRATAESRRMFLRDVLPRFSAALLNEEWASMQNGRDDSSSCATAMPVGPDDGRHPPSRENDTDDSSRTHTTPVAVRRRRAAAAPTTTGNSPPPPPLSSFLPFLPLTQSDREQARRQWRERERRAAKQLLLARLYEDSAVAYEGASDTISRAWMQRVSHGGGLTVVRDHNSRAGSEHPRDGPPLPIRPPSTLVSRGPIIPVKGAAAYCEGPWSVYERLLLRDDVATSAVCDAVLTGVARDMGGHRATTERAVAPPSAQHMGLLLSQPPRASCHVSPPHASAAPLDREIAIPTFAHRFLTHAGLTCVMDGGCRRIVEPNVAGHAAGLPLRCRRKAAAGSASAASDASADSVLAAADVAAARRRRQQEFWKSRSRSWGRGM